MPTFAIAKHNICHKRKAPTAAMLFATNEHFSERDFPVMQMPHAVRSR
jgi:hypothetical protein